MIGTGKRVVSVNSAIATGSNPHVRHGPARAAASSYTNQRATDQPSCFKKSATKLSATRHFASRRIR